jgi:hypothetical protein
MPQALHKLAYATPVRDRRIGWRYVALLVINLLSCVVSLFVLGLCAAWGRTITRFIGLPMAAIQGLVTIGTFLDLHGVGAAWSKRLRRTLMMPAILGAALSIAAIAIGFSFETEGC